MSGAMDQLYQQLILDHARARTGEGELEPFDAERFEKNPSCGDELRLRVRLDGAGDFLGAQDDCRVDLLDDTVSAAALRAMRTGYGQVKGRQIPVDIGDLAARQDGKGAVELPGRIGKLLRQRRGHFDCIGGLGYLDQRTIEIGEDRQLGDGVGSYGIDRHQG